ncbi:MAG: D-aminoacylase [Actinomycetia bacterium]|nr:D-aminoacylase [Actinomycetes bacterium]MCP4962005.1 D-aminoacylase [Actinomycetes bacterium]
MEFRNVTIVDGTGAAPFVGDVVVEGDRIVEVSVSTPPADGPGQATGLVLAPGFIDVHTHDDVQLLSTPDMDFKTLQGVTSVVVGNCGFSAAPSYADLPMGPSFATMTDYFAALDNEPAAVNATVLVGHGSVRSAVMGFKENREATSDEMAAMSARVIEALDAGAIGISSGLAYEPGRYSGPDEMKQLVGLVADAGGIYTTHMRNEANGLLDSIDESIAVAETTGAPLQISHLKASDRSVWGEVVPALEKIEAARARGVDVMFDQYPYTRGSTFFDQVANSGAFEGQSEFGSLSPEEVLIASAPGRPEWEGRTLAQVADDEGVDTRTMIDRIVTELDRRCVVILDRMCEEDVQTVMSHPEMIVGSDGVYGGSRPHPRLHHTYPRILGHYVRELGLLELPRAVQAMTSAAAKRFGFHDRGVIEAGAYADLVLFDPETIIDTGTYMDPKTVPTGIEGVWVNGTLVVENGAITGERPGLALRHR